MHTKNKKKKQGILSKAAHYINIAVLFSIAVFFLFTGSIILWASFIKLPDFNAFHERKIVESTKIYDRTGTILLYDVHEDVKRSIVPFDKISPLVKNAVIAIEDKDFYTHPGVSIQGIARAIIYGGTRGGGSTITQQVIKKTLLTDDKLVTRKIKEVILALKLEQNFTKDEILALYLNEIPYGGSLYGINEASRAFFGKEPNNLTLTQSAYLAAIPNAPTYLSPYGNHRDKLDERKNLVLKRMYDLGFITEKEYTEAYNEVVEFLPKEQRGIKAPHFVVWIKEHLAEKYGERAVLENGYKVVTTLDYNLQKKSEEIMDAHALDMEQKFGATNMALVAIDPKTGQILAMIGSRNYFEIENDGNFNVAINPNRQPGSTFKPFAYATAFMKGYTPETVLFDVPTNFSVECDAHGNPIVNNFKKEDCYTPENYEGGYRGPISMRSSLAQSRNITSVKTLYLAGIDETIATAHRMGITSLNDRSRYGLSLVLGGGEVSLLDMTSAYGVFANEGVRNPTTAILRIEDKNGNIIEEYIDKSEEVLPIEVARNITSILSDNKARTPTFGANSALYFPGKDVAVKTGTTNDIRDVWTVGYTPSIVLGMWAGNNDNTPIKKGNSAGFTVSLVWHAIMEDILAKNGFERFIAPEQEDLTKLPNPLAGVWQGGEKYIIDTISGKLATENTPTETKKIITIPDVHSILYWINKDTPHGTRPINAQNDPQFNLWEIPVREWVTKQNIIEGDRSAIPTEYDTVHTPESAPILSIAGIDTNKLYTNQDSINLNVTSIGVYPLSRVDLFINNQLIDKKNQAPFSFRINPDEIPALSNNNTITIIGYDSVFNKTVYNTEYKVE